MGMFFLYYFYNYVNALFEVMDQDNSYTAIHFLNSGANTVQFITADVYALDKMGKWNKQTGKDFQVNLEIYDVERKKICLSDSKPAADTNFFFTTPETSNYYILVTASEKNNEFGKAQTNFKKVGLDVKIFSGEKSMPEIVAYSDLEVNKAQNIVAQVLEYANKNLLLQ